MPSADLQRPRASHLSDSSSHFLRDLPLLVDALLNTSYFRMGHSVFKQCHGLTTCPSFTQCRCSFSRTLLLITFLATPRDFVDNVFFLDATKMLQTESFAIVSHPFFYCYPLEILEMENLLMMIGLVHTAHSAGSPTMALRNFHTHAHTDTAS